MTKKAEENIYFYNGKYYSNTDHSEDLEDYNNWGGNLYDLYWDASHGEEHGILCEETIYYNAYSDNEYFDNYEDLVMEYFEEQQISLEEFKKVSGKGEV